MSLLQKYHFKELSRCVRSISGRKFYYKAVSKLNFLKEILIVLFALSSLTIFSENSGYYSIVTIPGGRFVRLREEPKIFSSSPGRVEAGYDNLKTTWKTEKTGNTYWIEVDYEGVTGWLKRDEVTLRDFNREGINSKVIDEFLYSFASAFQKGNFDEISGLIYPLRGIAFYTYSVGRVEFYEKENLAKGWGFMTDKRFSTGTRINYYISAINKFLAGKFVINEEISRRDDKIPDEIKNFTYAFAENDKEALYIGLERWNNKLYVSYLALLRK